MVTKADQLERARSDVWTATALQNILYVVGGLAFGTYVGHSLSDEGPNMLLEGSTFSISLLCLFLWGMATYMRSSYRAQFAEHS
jgi:hypothetical protein